MSKHSHDRFTLPGDIPVLRDDASTGSASPQDERLFHKPAHGEEGLSSSRSERSGCEALPKAERPSRTTAHDGSERTFHPAGRGWTPLSRDLGIPGEHGPDGPAAALGCSAVFTRELRVRFLDHLAFNGNARAAARRVGVSHETAYRKRRQDAAFAALWDAALVHARHYGESELATRALDGVEVPVWHRGEIVGYQVKHDSRLLLAHLARLDRRIEGDAAAQARAGRFDELLAEYAGHEAPEGFAEAAREALDWRERGTAPELPPTRAEYVVYYRSLALDAAAADEEDEAMDDAGEEAGAEWDAWHGGALARVGAIVEGTGDSDDTDPHQAPSVCCADTSPVNGGGSGRSNPPSPDLSPSNPPPFTGEVPSVAKAEGASLAEGASATNEGDEGVTIPANPPYEIKSARALTRPISAPANRVTSVNPRDNCAGSAPFQSPYIAPVTLISRERGTRCTPS